MSLKTDYKDEILRDGEDRRYNLVNENGQVVYSNIKLEKAYTPQQEGDEFNAKDVNDITKSINQLSPPNLLINGDFQCWQRGENFTFEANQETRYVADLWYVWGYQGRIYKRDVGIAILSEAIICQCLEESLETGVTYTLAYSIAGAKGYIHLVGGTPYDQGRFIYTVNEGGHDRIKIRVNNETINYVYLYKGNIICEHQKEDYATALMRCQDYIRQYDNMIFNITYTYSNKKFIVEANYPKMKKVPTFAHGDCEMWAYDGDVIKINIESQSLTSTILTMRTAEASKDKKDGSYIIFVKNVVLSCEPL